MGKVIYPRKGEVHTAPVIEPVVLMVDNREATTTNGTNTEEETNV